MPNLPHQVRLSSSCKQYPVQRRRKGLEVCGTVQNKVAFCTNHTNITGLWSLCSCYKDWWKMCVNKPSFDTWVWDLVENASLSVVDSQCAHLFRSSSLLHPSARCWRQKDGTRDRAKFCRHSCFLVGSLLTTDSSSSYFWPFLSQHQKQQLTSPFLFFLHYYLHYFILLWSRYTCMKVMAETSPSFVILLIWKSATGKRLCFLHNLQWFLVNP